MNNIEESADTPPCAEPWQPVSPRYRLALQLYIALYGLVVLMLMQILNMLQPVPFTHGLTGAGLLIILFLILRWAPRKARFTRYLARDLDVHVQTGYWWQQTSSVAVNRIQHLEITQGPIERTLGLCKLVLYTAGGRSSDLKLPGLNTDTARQLKTQLLKQVTEEEHERPQDGIAG